MKDTLKSLPELIFTGENTVPDFLVTENSSVIEVSAKISYSCLQKDRHL